MGYFKGKTIRPKQVYYIANSKLYAPDHMNEAGRPGIIEDTPVIKETPVADDSVAIERNLYKSLYESFLNKVVCGGA